jgi:hypothetical protein
MMRRYGVTILVTGSQYIEVDCPNGEDPAEYAMDLVDPTKIEDWNFEVYDTDEVDTNEP